MLYQSQIQRYILTVFRTAWEKEPTKQFRVGELITKEDVKKDLKQLEIKELNDLIPYCYDLKERSFLYEDDMFWKITLLGRGALDKEFSYPYQSRKATIKLQEKREKKIEQEGVERRHWENLQESISQTKLTKYGIIGSIVLSVIGIVIATFAYTKQSP